LVDKGFGRLYQSKYEHEIGDQCMFKSLFKIALKIALKSVFKML